jgi:NDP-sugar pyrophosphorylase family protein/mannose-6-phosphate isomerase-like protein (cupin superfamily)
MINENILLGDIKDNKYINNKKIVEKPWGREIWLELNDKYCYKRIEIKAGFKTSYQIHNFKLETNYIIKGNAEVWLENDNGIVDKFYMNEGDYFTVIPKRKHRVIAITDIILQEVSTPEVDDVIRINDEFNRGNGKILQEHNTQILCIVAAGTGSRLGDISKKCHKTLLPYKNKAILTHIIEKFKPDIEIIIAVGYLKEQIIEYINFYHSDRNIKFIDVDNYDREGSGPAYSLECCRLYLNKPFYFCVSDFYTDTFLQNETFSTDNWIGLYETLNPEMYSTVQLQDETIQKLINKSQNGFNNAFTGIFYMYDFELFWNSFDKYVDEKKEIVDIFKNIQSFNFKIKKINWYDIGTLDLYNKFIENFEGNNLYLHNTKQEYKYIKDNLFIKKMESEVKIKNIINRSQYLEKYIPKIVNSGKYYLAYEYVKGNTLYYTNDKNKYLEFLNWFESNFCKNLCTLNNSSSQYAIEFYKIKTYNRLNILKKLCNFDNLDAIKKINGCLVLPIDEYLNMINWDDLSKIIITPLFHGDLQFDNIILTSTGEFKLIDWREDFGGNLEYGDLYYDLAKLYGGMELNYLKMKDQSNYSTSINENECIITEYKDIILKDIQQNEFIDFLKKNNLDKTRVKLLTALIFLNMAPLHINKFDIFLFYKSKKLFSEIFTDLKN